MLWCFCSIVYFTCIKKGIISISIYTHKHNTTHTYLIDTNTIMGINKQLFCINKQLFYLNKKQMSVYFILFCKLCRFHPSCMGMTIEEAKKLDQFFLLRLFLWWWCKKTIESFPSFHIFRCQGENPFKFPHAIWQT